MNLYLVSKKSQNETRTGVIEVAEMSVVGIFTTESRANDMAAKYDADVTSFVADKESFVAVQRWVNPGFVQD